MKLIDYIKKNKFKKIEFAKLLGVSRVTLDWYLRNPDRVTIPTKLAIEYITTGQVRREDWEEEKIDE